MADSAKKSAKQADDTLDAEGANRASADNGSSQSALPTTNSEADVTMGDTTHHLHRLAKGDNDFSNGTEREQTPTSEPKK